MGSAKENSYCANFAIFVTLNVVRSVGCLILNKLDGGKNGYAPTRTPDGY